MSKFEPVDVYRLHGGLYRSDDDQWTIRRDGGGWELKPTAGGLPTRHKTLKAARKHAGVLDAVAEEKASVRAPERLRLEFTDEHWWRVKDEWGCVLHSATEAEILEKWCAMRYPGVPVEVPEVVK